MNSIIDHARDTEDYPINETYTTTFEWSADTVDALSYALLSLRNGSAAYPSIVANWKI